MKDENVTVDQRFHAFRLHPSDFILGFRRGARVAELAALEMLCTGNRTVGSNPTLSATDNGGRMKDEL